MLIGGSQWFTPDDSHVGHAFNDVYTNYKNYLPGAKKQAGLTNEKFTLKLMTNRLGQLLDEKTKPIPKFIPLSLPTLNTIKLPTLKKIE